MWINSYAATGGHVGVFAGAPYLDPHAGFTTQALSHLAASDWLRGVVPWWNPYSGIGMPLAGGAASSSFFLPFLFLVLLSNGVLWLKIALQIIAGFASYALLRELRLGRLSALAGAIAFALNGTFSWFSYVAINPIPFLPLFLYGIERAYSEEGKNAGVFWIGVAIAWSLFAGFPETAYIDGLLALLWAAYRLIRAKHPAAFFKRVFYGGLLGLLLAAPLLIAFANYLHESNTFALHIFGGVSLPRMALSTLFLPYAYGPTDVTFGSKALAHIWANVGGYSGVVLVFLALTALPLRGQREKGLRLLLFCWVLLAWAKTFGFVPIISLMNHIPFLRQTEFYRYSPPSWELALAILAAFALEDFKTRHLDISLPLLITLVLVLFSAFLAWPWHALGTWGGEHEFIKSFFFISLAWALGGLAISAAAWTLLRGEARRWALGSLLVLETSIFFIVPELSGVRPGRVDQPAIRFLKNNLGLSRFYTFYPIQPNYGSYFRIAEINHNGVPVADNWTNFIDKSLFPPLAKSSDVVYLPDWPPYGKNAGQRYLFQFLKNYEKIGVRYVVTRSGEGLSLASFAFAAKSVTDPLTLFKGQSAHVSLLAPSVPNGEDRITEIGVFQGNYHHSADGRMGVRLCAGGACATGSVSLVGSVDDSFLYVPLSHFVAAKSGAAMTITISNKGGRKPFAVWLQTTPQGQDQHLYGPSGKISGKALCLILRYSARVEGIKKVYSDSLMDIWELPHPKPYYTIRGGPCVLSDARRESVRAICAAPAKLIHRELYMPGWRAKINGVTSPVSSYDEILQSVRLPVGKNLVRWSFIPPYAEYGWIAFVVGLIGLAFEGTFILLKKSDEQ
jgi:hypothetical protein